MNNVSHIILYDGNDLVYSSYEDDYCNTFIGLIQNNKSIKWIREGDDYMDLRGFSRDELVKEINRRGNKLLSNKPTSLDKSNFDIDGLYDFFEDHFDNVINDIINGDIKSLEDIYEDDESIEFKECLYHFVLNQIYRSKTFYDYIQYLFDNV